LLQRQVYKTYVAAPLSSVQLAFREHQSAQWHLVLPTVNQLDSIRFNERKAVSFPLFFKKIQILN